MEFFSGESCQKWMQFVTNLIKMGPEVLYCCWVLLPSLGVINSLCTIFFETPCRLTKESSTGQGPNRPNHIGVTVMTR